MKAIEKAKQYLKDRLSIVKLPWRRRQMGKDLCEWLGYNDDNEFIVRIETQIGEINNRLLTGREFCEVANKPRHYLINKLLARRQVAVISGPPKAFKTWMALNIVRCLIEPGSVLFGIPELYSGEKPCNVLIIEEEGDAEELYQRAEKVLQGTDWHDRTVWSHHLGVKLDQDDWVEKIESWVEKHEVDVILFDPFQRLHTKDENSAADMGDVWATIHRLTTKYKHLGIILLHHFNKTSGVEDEWNALRGSSRTAGEADLGIFVDKLPISHGKGCKIRLSGRTLPDLDVYEEGSHTLRLPFDNDSGLLLFGGNKVTVIKHLSFLEVMREKKTWTVNEAAKHFETTTTTINNWISKLPEGSIVRISPGPGRPAAIVYNEISDAAL
jgi:hypothetical protein